MNSKFFTFFKRKRAFLGITLVGAIAASGVVMKTTASKRAELSRISEGVQTCFIRVQQSYTAKLLGQNGLDYLSSSFMATSEECFSEALGSLKTQFASDAKNSIRSLNLAATSVHQLHQKMKDTADTSAQSSELFSKLETAKDETLDGLAQENESFAYDFQNSRNLFFVFCALFPFLALWEIIERRRAEARHLAVENEALVELQKGELKENPRVEGLLKSAFQIGELDNCQRLFEAWTNARSQHMTLASSLPQVAPVAQMPVELAPVQKVEALPLVLEEERVEENSLHVKDVVLDPLVARVVDQLSSKIFSAGIVLELDMDDDLHVQGREDVVHELLFHAMLRSVNALSEKIGPRRLTLVLKSNGNQVNFEVRDNCENVFSVKESIELSLCRELIDELGGAFSFEERDESTLVSLSFMKGEGAKRLVSLKRGKKKDLMRELSV